MRTAGLTELRNKLSKYLAFARSGEEVVICDRNLPVARLVSLSAENADEEELRLAAAGKLRLPKESLDLEALRKIRTGKVKGNRAIESLLADRKASR